MELLIVGINHRSAPISLREQVAFTPDQLGHALQDLQDHADLRELAILSTCNRTEIISIAGHQDPGPVIEWLANYHQLPPADLQDSMYVRSTEEAVSHAMRVACGLDSMVLGEPQILGQFKECFSLAQFHKTLGAELNRLSQSTYRVAKKVRTNTAIGKSSVSIASTAVKLASQLFSDLSRCNSLLIGAGDTTRLVAQHLRKAGIKEITIANRTLANAQTLARELDAQATDLSAIPFHLANTDILIASTASQLPILGKGSVEKALKQRRHKPIFMVDLAVPRDIEPEVGELRDVYLYSIDDLQQIVAKNLSHREEEASQAEAIISAAVRDFIDDDKSLQARDTLVRFRERNEELKEAELTLALARLQKGEESEKVIRSLANQLTNKFIHTPTIQLKQAGKDDRHDLLNAIEDLFQLGDEPRK